MTLATDIANDLSTMDGYTSMTLTPAGGSPITCYGIPHGLIGSRPVFVGGMALAPGDRLVSIQANTTSSTAPKHPDKLTIGGVIYTVMACDLVTLGTRYRVGARKESP